MNAADLIAGAAYLVATMVGAAIGVKCTLWVLDRIDSWLE